MTSENASKEFKDHIATLRKRSFRTKLYARAIFWFLVMPSIVIAIIIVIEAPRLTGIERAKYEIARRTTTYRYINERIGRTKERLRNSELSQRDKEFYERRLDRYKRQREEIEQELGKDTFSDQSPTIRSIQINIIRIGIIVVILFGVSVLIGNYRQMIRLSIFYEKCADAFELYSMGIISIEILQEIVQKFPVVDYGKIPSLPEASLFESTRAIGGSKNQSK